MPRPLLRLTAVAAVLVLSGCASVPAPREGVLAAERPLETIDASRHRQVAQFVDADALRATPRIALPAVEIAGGAHGPRIEPAQAALVANHAARSLCLGLSRHAELAAAPAPDALQPRIVVTAIEPTSGAAAGASSVIGIFVPGPFRLPAGLGGLAVDAELRDPRAGQVAAMRWARGANAVTQDAKVSAIGDAWQLAGRFGEEFARAVLDTDPARAGLQRARLSDAAISANRAACAQRFGTVNLAGRGASLLLPLAPEAIDPGPPGAAVAVGDDVDDAPPGPRR
jgi:hypothetical protein